VNSGGEPERDDTGLPPVDIEIPDDARELDRDVQAYYREQRAERRRLRHHRMRSKVARDGFLLPLLACCLILALITGTLLTVFTATSDQNPARLPNPAKGTSQPPAGRSPSSGTGTRSASHRPASSSPAPSGAASGSPSAPVSSAGSRTGSAASPSAVNPIVQSGAPLPASGTLVLQPTNLQVPLRSLTLHGAMLVLVPPACACGTAVSWLAGIAASHDVQTYLVRTPPTASEVNDFHSQLPANLQRAVHVALDSLGVLAHTYTVIGLTAVMVASHSPAGQSVAYAQNLSAEDNPAPLLRALAE
jgi:hypothetical protein